MALTSNTHKINELKELISKLPDRHSGDQLPELVNEGRCEDLAEGKELIDASGNIVVGTLAECNDFEETNFYGIACPEGSSALAIFGSTQRELIMRNGSGFMQWVTLQKFGDVKPEEVLKGKTFTSTSGMNIEGSLEIEDTGIDLPALSDDVKGSSHDLCAGKKLYSDDGSIVEGDLDIYDGILSTDCSGDGDAVWDSQNNKLKLSGAFGARCIIEEGTSVEICCDKSVLDTVIPKDEPTPPNLIDIALVPGKSTTTYTPGEDCDGYKSVTVIGDSQLSAENIKKGVVLFDGAGDTEIIGTYEGEAKEPKLRDETFTENGSYTAGDGYDGFGVITVNVSASTDSEPDPRDPYQRVEYIESAEEGTYPYIITDFYGDNDSGMEIIASFPVLQDRIPMGSRENSDATRFYCAYPMSASSIYYGFNTGSSISCALKINTIYRLQTNFLNSRIVAAYNMDGIRQGNSGSISATLTQQSAPVSIFGYHLASSATVTSKREYKLYSARCSRKHEVVREYIPCYRKSDGVVGLYEKFTGQFLTAVEGSFAKGPDIEW